MASGRRSARTASTTPACNGSGQNDFGRLRGADLVEELWSTEMQVLDDMSGAIGAIQ